MTTIRKTYLAALVVLLSPMAANADLFAFSYDTGGGVLTFDFQGDLQADNDTIEVTAILGTVEVDGVAAFMLPFVGARSEYATTFTGIGPGIMSLSGITMDILACEQDGCIRGFLIATNSYSTGGLGQAGGFNVENFSITAMAVPEPGTLALLGLGLAGIGFAKRKKA